MVGRVYVYECTALHFAEWILKPGYVFHICRSRALLGRWFLGFLLSSGLRVSRCRKYRWRIGICRACSNTPGKDGTVMRTGLFRAISLMWIGWMGRLVGI